MTRRHRSSRDRWTRNPLGRHASLEEDLALTLAVVAPAAVGAAVTLAVSGVTDVATAREPALLRTWHPARIVSTNAAVPTIAARARVAVRELIAGMRRDREGTSTSRGMGLGVGLAGSVATVWCSMVSSAGRVRGSGGSSTHSDDTVAREPICTGPCPDEARDHSPRSCAGRVCGSGASGGSCVRPPVLLRSGHGPDWRSGRRRDWRIDRSRDRNGGRPCSRRSSRSGDGSRGALGRGWRNRRGWLVRVVGIVELRHAARGAVPRRTSAAARTSSVSTT